MLKELRVTNLGPIAEATLSGENPVTLILGPNESGKSTMLEALSVLYFGTRGAVPVAGNMALTKSGTKGWKVEAVLADGEILTATRSQRPKREVLAKHLGDPRVFSALCNVEDFLTMTSGDRKQLLADLAASDTLALADDLKSRGVDPAIVAAVRDGKMKRAHALATDLRRAEDRKINALADLAESEVEDTEIETKKGALKISTVPLATVEGGIERLAKRLYEIRQASSKLETYERTERDANVAKEELADLMAEVDWSAGDRSRLEELRGEMRTLRAESGKHTIQIGAASELDAQLEILQNTAGDCPTCRAPMNSAGAIEALKDARKAAGKTINHGKGVCKRNSETLAPMEEEATELLKREQRAGELNQTRTRLKAKIEALSGDAPVMPKGDADALSAEIGRLQAMRDARKEYDTRIKDQTRALKVVESLTPLRDKLALLEKELDPSAIGDEEAILTEINGHLARTCGKLGVPTVLNDGYELSIHGRHPDLASDSARLRAGFGVACALSILGGVGLAFLDRFEALDDDNRKRVLGLLKGLHDEGLLGMVLIGVVKKNPVKVGNVPWLASVSLADGTATYLEN